MAERKFSVLSIIAIILGISGFGIGIFSIVNPQVVEDPQGPPGPVDFVAGLWESLYKNTDYNPHDNDCNWLIEVGDAQINNSNLLFLSRNNTRFHLVKSGWYRFNLIMLWGSLTPSDLYYMQVLQNDALFLEVERYLCETDVHYQIDVMFYVSSNGTDYYDICCRTLGSGFDMYLGQHCNQLGIEYLGEY